MSEGPKACELGDRSLTTRSRDQRRFHDFVHPLLNVLEEFSRMKSQEIIGEQYRATENCECLRVGLRVIGRDRGFDRRIGGFDFGYTHEVAAFWRSFDGDNQIRI